MQEETAKTATITVQVPYDRLVFEYLINKGLSKKAKRKIKIRYHFLQGKILTRIQEYLFDIITQLDSITFCFVTLDGTVMDIKLDNNELKHFCRYNPGLLLSLLTEVHAVNTNGKFNYPIGALLGGKRAKEDDILRFYKTVAMIGDGLPQAYSYGGYSNTASSLNPENTIDRKQYEHPQELGLVVFPGLQFQTLGNSGFGLIITDKSVASYKMDEPVKAGIQDFIENLTGIKQSSFEELNKKKISNLPLGYIKFNTIIKGKKYPIYVDAINYLGIQTQQHVLFFLTSYANYYTKILEKSIDTIHIKKILSGAGFFSGPIEKIPNIIFYLSLYLCFKFLLEDSNNREKYKEFFSHMRLEIPFSDLYLSISNLPSYDYFYLCILQQGAKIYYSYLKNIR